MAQTSNTSLLSPGSDPGLGVHLQTGSPAAVFLWRGGEEAPLGGQLLCDRPDVVGLETAAAADEADAGVVGLSGELVHVPARQDPGLQTWREIDTHEIPQPRRLFGCRTHFFFF